MQLAYILDNILPPSSRSQGSGSWWAPRSSHRREGSSPGTPVSPLMPTNSCQQTAPSLNMLSSCYTKTILWIMMQMKEIFPRGWDGAAPQSVPVQ